MVTLPSTRHTPLFTVFTPTRNRAHVLHRVYESLGQQTCRDFEWLVIDNGSTDRTGDLVRTWQAEADFPIRYLYQENQGVHVSWNRAANEARGTLLLFIRDADTFVPSALERFKTHWEAIPPDRRDRFSAVTALCVDEHGTLLGTEFPRDCLDSDSTEIRFRYKVKGEKWGFQRTDVLRTHPLPVPPGYHGYVPESIMWRAIARHYKTRYVNERLRVYWQDQTHSVSRSGPLWDKALGGMIENESLLNDDIRWFRYAPVTFLHRALVFSRLAFHTGRSARSQWRALNNPAARLLWLGALGPGWIMYIVDSMQKRGLRRIDPGEAREAHD